MRKNMKKINLFVLIIVSILSPLYGQITIGSGQKPVTGALLDLKEDDITTKGLGLPRVALTDKNNIATDIFGVTAENADAHIGLLVYNINECVIGIEKGLYVWVGSNWELLHGSILSATYEENSGSNIWGTKVVRHQAKPKGDGTNIYEEFYSADFGDAGRWMTTNLTARSFETEGRTASDITVPTQLSANPSISPIGNNVELHWAYPFYALNQWNLSTVLDADPSVGLLYSWPAATNSKTGSSAGTGDNEVARNYGEQTAAGRTILKIQGVCPNGWHLPSDWEWTQLEQVIIEQTPKYAKFEESIYVTDGNDYSGVIYDKNQITTGVERGTTHSQAMKSPCPPILSELTSGGVVATRGKSFSKIGGGFNALLVGSKAHNTSTSISYGLSTFFWTSSSRSINDGWYRRMTSDASNIYQGNNTRGFMFSVRCKKD